MTIAFRNAVAALLAAVLTSACGGAASIPTAATPVQAVVSVAAAADLVPRAGRNCVVPVITSQGSTVDGVLYLDWTRSPDTGSYRVKLEQRASSNDAYLEPDMRTWTLPTQFEARGLPAGVYRVSVGADCSSDMSGTVIISVGGGGSDEAPTVPPAVPGRGQQPPCVPIKFHPCED